MSWWEWRAEGVAIETREGVFTKESGGQCLPMEVGSDAEWWALKISDIFKH